MKMSHVSNGFIDVSSKLDALALFFARLLSGSLHRALLRNAVLNVTPIIPATACHQRNYVERYSRFKRCTFKRRAMTLCGIFLSRYSRMRSSFPVNLVTEFV